MPNTFYEPLGESLLFQLEIDMKVEHVSIDNKMTNCGRHQIHWKRRLSAAQ